MALSSSVERHLEDLASALRLRSGAFIQCGYFFEVKKLPVYHTVVYNAYLELQS